MKDSTVSTLMFPVYFFFFLLRAMKVESSAPFTAARSRKAAREEETRCGRKGEEKKRGSAWMEGRWGRGGDVGQR